MRRLGSRNQVLGVLLGAFLGLGLVTYLLGAIDVIGRPYELLPGEGFKLFQAGLVSDGAPLYRPLTTTQYFIDPYTPLYTLVSGWLSWLFGVSLLVGRLVSLVSGLGVVIGVYLLTSRITGSRVAGTIAGLLLVSTLVFRFLGPLYRMDMMGLAFSILGIYIVTRSEKKGAYWSVPLFLLAFFTKQYYIAAPATVGLYLLTKGNWRVFFRYSGMYLGGLVGSLLVGGLLTDWELVTQPFLYLGGTNLMAWENLVGALKKLAFYHFPIFLGVIGYFGYRAYLRRPLLLAEVYFLVSLAVLLMAVGKIGGGFHYGLEIVAVGSVLVGVLIGKVFQVFSVKGTSLQGILLGSSLLALVPLQVLGFPLGQGLLVYRFLDTTAEANQEVVSYLSSIEGTILSDRLYFPLEGGPKWDVYEPAMLFVGKLYEKGWDQSVLVKRLETGYYELVITPDPLLDIWDPDTDMQPTSVSMYRERLSVDVATAVLDNYSLVLESDWMGTNWVPYKTYIFRYRR